MITTVLMDYDSTLHDMDGVMEMTLDGILGLKGRDLYKIWVYDIHRALIHKKYLNRHDDLMFHCMLLFEKLDKPFKEEMSEIICKKIDTAREQAKTDPIYYPDIFEALDALKTMGLKLCLSTGFGAKEKARTLESLTGKKYFSYAFSEEDIGYLKTETEYYEEALNRAGASSDETISVGDTPLSDIRPAKLLGIKTVWVNRVLEEKPMDFDQVADYEVSNLMEVVEIIRKINCIRTA